MKRALEHATLLAGKFKMKADKKDGQFGGIGPVGSASIETTHTGKQ